MTEQDVLDLRARIAAGEEVTEDELREAIKVISQARSAAVNKPRRKAPAVDDDEAADLIALSQ
jgi:hypothetical protein